MVLAVYGRRNAPRKCLAFSPTETIREAEWMSQTGVRLPMSGPG